MRLDEGEVALLSRRGKDWTAQFPELVAAARKLKARQALVDGEAAIVLDNGKTSFQALQNFFGGDRRGLTYFAFDLLFLDGEDLRARPLEERKERLAALVKEAARASSGCRSTWWGTGPPSSPRRAAWGWRRGSSRSGWGSPTRGGAPPAG